MVIGLDFDDVLMDFRASMEGYCCDRYGVCITRDESTSYDLWDRWGCTKEESIQRVLDFYVSEHHHKALPVHGAPEALKTLSKEHSLVVITSRPDFTQENTLKWLRKHFDMSLFDRVYFANLFASDKPKRNKSEICHELGVDVFVDDYHVYAEDVAKSGKKVLLFDAPWNRGYGDHPNITRVHSWDQILEILK